MTIKHAAFTLENKGFAVMDSARKHDFTFNEAISFMVECEPQEEIDYYGSFEDKFGVKWMVIYSYPK